MKEFSNMSVQAGRMVSAEEARDWLGATHSWGPAYVDLAHTVVVQAEQIAAVRALAERWQSVAADLDESKLTATLSAVFGTQAGCGDSIIRALRVSEPGTRVSTEGAQVDVIDDGGESA